MKYFTAKKYDRAGMFPGELVLPEGKKEERARVTVISYTPSDLTEKEISNPADISDISFDRSVNWINIEGIHDLETIEEIGRLFKVHPLHLEDILETEQRPKIDDQNNYLLVMIKMVYLSDKTEDGVEYEHLTVFINEDTVITFQEKPGDVFDPIRNRIRNAKGRIRKMGADYLAYALLDAIVDNYFVVPEKLGEQMETLEMKIVTAPSTETLMTIHRLKRNMISLRKAVWPLREVISNLERSENKIIKRSTVVYLRDVYSHAIQVADLIETSRDMLSGMTDLYMSSVSNKMNDTMKILTVIATIFIPLTFIAGVYGMNFDFMPELHWKYGYFAVISVMLVMAFSMLLFFKRKKWI